MEMPQLDTDKLNAAKAQIKTDVESNKIVLFMKGTKMAPQCGFSGQVNHILSMIGAPYETRNVLEDPYLRQGIKDYSDWPTIPQLYVDGEFLGGCDIVTDMYQNGELSKLLAPYETRNVLEDPYLRQGIKDYSDFPQLYVDGEFLGGCDIVTDMYQNGELLRDNSFCKYLMMSSDSYIIRLPILKPALVFCHPKTSVQLLPMDFLACLPTADRIDSPS